MIKNQSRPRIKFRGITVLVPYCLGTSLHIALGASEARTMREQSIRLGTSGYDPKTAQWSLYEADKICQEYIEVSIWMYRLYQSNLLVS